MSEHKVRVGQVWSDDDPRTAPRYLRILQVIDGYAQVSRCTAEGLLLNPGRKPTKIRLDRLEKPRSGGYSLRLDASDDL